MARLPFFSYNSHPEQDESFMGYLYRLACKNGNITLESLLHSLGKQLKASVFEPNQRVRVEIEALLSQLQGDAKLEFADDTFLSDEQSAVNSLLTTRMRYCPACIAERFIFKVSWQAIFSTHCEVHSLPLIDACPSCATPLKWSIGAYKRCAKSNCDFADGFAPHSPAQDELPGYQSAAFSDLTYRRALMTALLMAFRPNDHTYISVKRIDFNLATLRERLRMAQLIVENQQVRDFFLRSGNPSVHGLTKYIDGKPLVQQMAKWPEPKDFRPASEVLFEIEPLTEHLPPNRLNAVCDIPLERQSTYRVIADMLGLSAIQVRELVNAGAIEVEGGKHNIRTKVFDIKFVAVVLRAFLELAAKNKTNKVPKKGMSVRQLATLLEPVGVHLLQVVQHPLFDQLQAYLLVSSPFNLSHITLCKASTIWFVEEAYQLNLFQIRTPMDAADRLGIDTEQILELADALCIDHSKDRFIRFLRTYMMKHICCNRVAKVTNTSVSAVLSHVAALNLGPVTQRVKGVYFINRTNIGDVESLYRNLVYSPTLSS